MSQAHDWNHLESDARTRNITDLLQKKLISFDVPHVNLKSPVAVRTYPPELYQSIRIKDFLRSDVFTEEIAARGRWFLDMEDLDSLLSNWDRRYTMFFYFASERFEPVLGKYNNALDELAAWLRLPKILIKYHVDKRTDEVWCAFAKDWLEKRAAKMAELYPDLSERDRHEVWNGIVQDNAHRGQ